MDSFSKDKKSLLKKEKISAQDTNKTQNFKISFQYLDTSQKFGSSFKGWQKDGLLSTALETLRGYCCSPLLEQVDGNKFAIYGAFPTKDRTMFEYPKGVPEDANWARIHINNKTVIIGHIVRDTFYIVFLDKEHKFYLTGKSINKK